MSAMGAEQEVKGFLRQALHGPIFGKGNFPQYLEGCHVQPAVHASLPFPTWSASPLRVLGRLLSFWLDDRLRLRLRSTWRSHGIIQSGVGWSACHHAISRSCCHAIISSSWHD